MCRANGWSDLEIDDAEVAELQELVDVWVRTGRAVAWEDWRE